VADRVALGGEAVVLVVGRQIRGGMTVRELPDVLAARWPEIERTVLGGRYQPQPVRRVMICCLGTTATAMRCLGAMEDNAQAYRRAVSSRGCQEGGL
jgi:hypothetical protein